MNGSGCGMATPPKECLDALRLAKRGPGAGEPNPVLMAPEIRNVAE